MSTPKDNDFAERRSAALLAKQAMLEKFKTKPDENDPAVQADWGVTDPILSERDQANPGRADLPAGRRPYWKMRT